jgi:ribosome-associated protein
MAKTAPAKKKPLKKTPLKKSALPKKTTARKRPAPKPEPEMNKLIALAAAEFALEKKATDIKILDVRGITSMTDYFVLCTGTSDLQVKAIAENVLANLRDRGVKPWKSEGWDAMQWVIVDFVDVVVHVFSEPARKFYHLERLWADAPMEIMEDKPKPKRKKVLNS